MQEKVKGPPSSEFSIVGKRPIRPDGLDKVTGRAKFGADLSMAGQLVGKVLRSPHPHARIKSINTAKAAALPGVKAVMTGKETPSFSSGILGGHVGGQLQFGQFVLGGELAYSGTSPFDSGFNGGVCKVNAAFTCDGRLHSLFTVVPRIGWTPGNNLLVYVTGGYANGQVRTRNNLIATGALFEHTSVNQDGWFVGGGLEFALTKNLILGAEYQRVSLDSALHINAVTAADNRTVSSDIDVVRARLTFKLGN